LLANFADKDIGHTMFFLIEYNRRKGEVVSMRRFADAEWSRAVDAQFALEKSVMQRGIDHEVVLLRSESEETLRRAYMRYFCSLEEIAAALFGEIERRRKMLEEEVRRPRLEAGVRRLDERLSRRAGL
jgi:hypothetical protein